MIELPVYAVAFLVVFATIGLLSTLRFISRPRHPRIRIDGTVNSKRHLVAAALTSQAHRHGDPEF